MFGNFSACNPRLKLMDDDFFSEALDGKIEDLLQKMISIDVENYYIISSGK